MYSVTFSFFFSLSSIDVSAVPVADERKFSLLATQSILKKANNTKISVWHIPLTPLCSLTPLYTYCFCKTILRLDQNRKVDFDFANHHNFAALNFVIIIC